jgi:hypothetical protein
MLLPIAVLVNDEAASKQKKENSEARVTRL